MSIKKKKNYAKNEKKKIEADNQKRKGGEERENEGCGSRKGEQVE